MLLGNIFHATSCDSFFSPLHDIQVVPQFWLPRPMQPHLTRARFLSKSTSCSSGRTFLTSGCSYIRWGSCRQDLFSPFSFISSVCMLFCKFRSSYVAFPLCASAQLQNQEALRVQLKRAEQEISVKLAEAMRGLEDPVQRQRALVEEDRHKYLGLEERVLTQLG